MSQPRISMLNTWERHVELISAILFRALLMLRAQEDTDGSEITLNRKLYFCLLQANRDHLSETGDGFDHPPVSEAHNPPDGNDEVRSGREDKIPDFLWSFVDHAAEVRDCARHFVIECKRLGTPKRSDWVFNDNYVINGVKRFISEDYAYAKGDRAAAMVGYVQSMELADILNEVNAVLSTVGISDIICGTTGWQEASVSVLDHSLPRNFRISPLNLGHYWIDLRN